MKIWMKAPGEILHLTFSNGSIDLRNTSNERPVVVDDELGKKLLLNGIVFEATEPVKVVKPVEKIVEPPVEETVVKDWPDKTWHEKKAFANDNEYSGENYKEDTLDNWYKEFIKNNEI